MHLDCTSAEVKASDVISSQLQECLGQPGICVPALASKHADHGGHDRHSRANSSGRER